MIALSAGHYQKRPGAKHFRLIEHDVAWRLVHEIEYILDYDLHHIFEVKIIKPAHLNEKIKQVKKIKPDIDNIAVEIHLNAGKGAGSETLYYHKSYQGKRLARSIQDKLSDFLPIRSRGAKPRKNLAWLKKTPCPAVIVEPLFMDNKWEKEYLKTQKGIRCLAMIISSGISDFFYP